jgi:hypothetical protein
MRTQLSTESLRCVLNSGATLQKTDSGCPLRPDCSLVPDCAFAKAGVTSSPVNTNALNHTLMAASLFLPRNLGSLE